MLVRFSLRPGLKLWIPVPEDSAFHNFHLAFGRHDLRMHTTPAASTPIGCTPQGCPVGWGSRRLFDLIDGKAEVLLL
jgi:hypothetical protein